MYRTPLALVEYGNSLLSMLGDSFFSGFPPYMSGCLRVAVLACSLTFGYALKSALDFALCLF